jgi:hypothetical protein
MYLYIQVSNCPRIQPKRINVLPVGVTMCKLVSRILGIERGRYMCNIEIATLKEPNLVIASVTTMALNPSPSLLIAVGEI